MTKKIVLLGASGGCVDVLDTLYDINLSSPFRRYDCVGFLDDNEDLHGQRILGAPVLGPFQMASDLQDECFFATAMGSEQNYSRRKEIIEALGIAADRFETLIHPTASISEYAKIGRGVIIHQNVTITRHVEIGDNVLVLPNTVVSHGSKIGCFSIVNAGVCIAGDVQIEESCYIGANSSIRQNVTVHSKSLVGMGGVVIRDVPSGSVVVGSPARLLAPKAASNET